MESVGYILKREHAYILFLALTIVIGFINGRIKTCASKQIFLTVTSVLLVLIFCGIDSVHSISSTILGILIIKKFGGGDYPRRIFVFAFLYRYFFSAAYYIGYPRNENNLANGIQLILTLKLISVAYEIKTFRNSHENKKQEYQNGSANEHTNWINKTDRHKVMPLIEEPSSIDIFSYLFCTVGLTTGPFFRYRTYYDMLHIPPSVSVYVPDLLYIGRKIITIFILIITSLSLSHFYPPNTVGEDSFYTETTLLYRLSYCVPLGTNLLCKYSIAWTMAECAYSAARLGVYPAWLKPKAGRGPSEFDNAIVWKENDESLKTPEGWSFVATQNIYPLKAMTSLTYNESFNYWNCSVQWWLSHFVYSSRLLPRNIKVIRWLAVSMICSTWHGFKAGHYFAFFCLPMIVFAEQSAENLIGKRCSGFARKVFVFANWFVYKIMGFATFMTVYSLSTYTAIVRYLSSVYFSIYSISFVFIIANIFVSQLKANVRFNEKPKVQIKKVQ